MAEAGRQSTESTAEETENPDIAEQVDRGTYQEILNLLNIMESESEKTDIALLGLNMRKALALGIITEKANREPSAVMNVLIYCLQMPEISTQRKVTIYNVLQEILQQEGELEEQCVQRLVIIASKEMRDVLEVEGYIMADVASDTLVALSRNHFNLVMFEMQHHLKPLTLNDEFVIITLAKLANGNVFEFMPYMGITLTTIFTMLRLANEAKMRQVICRAIETFCETVQYYLRHLEDSVYPVMTQEQFANKLFPIYCYFVTTWLKNDNAEVKLAVIRCLKPMLNLLLPNDHLREQIYDYIPLILAEYQSSMEALFITQVLRQILEAAVITHTPVPQMQLHIIFTELHTQVCSLVATQHQYSSQNQTEIVHCFIALARSYPKELMNFFLRQMEMSKEAVRVGTLSLIEAIVGADDPEMSKRTIHLAINVVKSILPDPRSKVRIAVLKIIGQLALSGYQDQIKSWALKYVSVQLTLSTYKLKNCRDSFYLRDLKEKMVHKVTMDTVKIMTSSVSGMANEFWVRFLCYILDTDYPEALTSICISLTNLAERQIHEKDTGAGTTIPRRHVDLPAPQKLLARLLVLMSSPYKCEGRGIAILKLLRILSQSIAPSMTDVWELEIPILIQYLEEHTEFTWNQKTWEEKLIQFLKSSLRKTQGLNWSMWLSQELSNQMDHFDSPSLEKGFLYRALGVSLATGLKANKVEVLLLELLYKTDYGNDFEREGVVLSCGLCARGQVMTVLKALGEFEKRIQESEQSWQVCIWQKDQPWWQESLKSVLMDMYGCVATYCHPQMLLTQLEHIITTKIIRHYSSSCQDISLKMAFMKGIIQVAGALKTMEHLEVLQFVQKATVTSIIMEILKAEPAERLDSPVRTRALDALILLSKLKPFYSEEENNELMDICIHSVISLVPPDEDNDAIKMLYTDAMRALEELMENLMERQLDPKVLQEMVQLLEKWILSEKAWEREKALNLYLSMMQTYVQNIDICIPLKLGQFGTLVGFIVPCTCDPHRRVRMASIDVLSVLLDLNAYQTCSLRYTSKEKVFLDCKEDLDSFEEEKIFGASARISRVVCMEFSCDEVVSLIQKLCENIGAVDLQHDKASVTWMGTFLQMRVKELEDKVAEIMAIILAHLRSVDHPEVRRTLMEDILLLANHHPDIVLTLLLRQPLPMESHLTEVWLAVTEDPHLTRTMLHGLMGRLQLQFRAHVNATSKADTWRLATVDPMMILCTINVLLDKVNQDDGLPDILPELVYTLLLQLGSSQWPKAASRVLKTWDLVYSDALIQNIKLQRVTINCLKLLIKRGQSGDLMHGLEEQGAWGLLENHTSFLGGIALFTRLFLRNMREHQHHLSQLVLQGMNSDVLSCCIMSTAMCVELMRSPVLHQDKLLKPAMLLLERAVDHEEEVLRVLSLRALGNMAHGAPKKVKKYQKLLLGKFLYCLQEPTNIHVVAEAMASLTKVLPELREWDLGSMFDNICRQCRAFFDNEDKVLRQKAFILFGKLAAMVRITKKRLFKREVKRAWVPLMLHCLDPCACTAKACMETMSQCLRFCGVKGLESPQGQSTESMEEIALFQTAICALLSQKKPAALKQFLMETVQYVKSTSPWMRIASCQLAGIILNQMSLRYLKKLDLPALQNLFQELQVDEELGVKTAAHDVLNILDNCNRSRMDS